MNREFFVKLFGIPTEYVYEPGRPRNGCYKPMTRFFETEIITRTNLDKMYRQLGKTCNVRNSSRYGVMKAFLGYEMTWEDKAYISGRAGMWGVDPVSKYDTSRPVKFIWTNDVMRAVLYPKMTKDQVWELLFREAHDIRTKEIEEENARDKKGIDFTELGGRPVESFHKSNSELRVLKSFEKAGFEIN